MRHLRPFNESTSNIEDQLFSVISDCISEIGIDSLQTFSDKCDEFVNNIQLIWKDTTDEADFIESFQFHKHSRIVTNAINNKKRDISDDDLKPFLQLPKCSIDVILSVKTPNNDHIYNPYGPKKYEIESVIKSVNDWCKKISRSEKSQFSYPWYDFTYRMDEDYCFWNKVKYSGEEMHFAQIEFYDGEKKENYLEYMTRLGYNNNMESNLRKRLKKLGYFPLFSHGGSTKGCTFCDIKFQKLKNKD